jgi:hypothetical protein
MRLAAEWSVIESLSASALKQSHQPVAMVSITPSYRECIDAGTNVVKLPGQWTAVSALCMNVTA